jgi:ferrochelatase
MNYDAVLLTSFGGPESSDDVMPFLERVTAGRGVSRERLEEVSHHYLALGGVSPINEQNRLLLADLRQEMKNREIAIPIYWGNRNSDPYFKEVLLQMYSDGHDRVLAWVTSAYSSYSGCRQYRENLAQALAQADLSGKMTIDKVRHYFDHPGFIQPFARGLAQAIEQLFRNSLKQSEIKILFTTHSIPLSMATSSGSEALRVKHPEGIYVAQHRAVAALVIAKAKKIFDALPEDWELVYQSRSGSPQVDWLEPDVGSAIRDASGSGYKAVVIIPIGFVSDHVEVVWDLDTEAKEIAERAGIQFIRVATPGIAPEFVSGIVDLLEERISARAPRALSSLGPWANYCSADCCPNPRIEMPVIAELPK